MSNEFLMQLRCDGSSITDEKGKISDIHLNGGLVTGENPLSTASNAFYLCHTSYYNYIVANIGSKLKGTYSEGITFAFWAKEEAFGGNGNTVLVNANTSSAGASSIRENLMLTLGGNYIGYRIMGEKFVTLSLERIKYDAERTQWNYYEYAFGKNATYLFVNGILIATYPSCCDYITLAYPYFMFGNHPYDTNKYCNYWRGLIWDFVIYSGVKHTEDYHVPFDYFKLSSRGLLTSLQPLNFLYKSRVTGFNIAGIEPEKTSRHVAFKVDDVWNKLTVSSGTAKLTALETQEITADSIIAEGNTVTELQSVTDCAPFVGKLVYPAVALYADADAEVMPKFGMTVNALIDTTVNVYTYTDYSQEYAISDGDDISIISLVAETELKGNGKVDITARIKTGGEWSEYMSLNSVQMKQASAIQLKAVYTVQNTDGSDSAKITGVVIKYNTAGAVTSNATTEIVTVTQRFTNDLTYVHAYCKHKELIDAEINAYCSIRKQPSKRVQYQVGNGTGALKTYTLPDGGVNQDTLVIYVDGKSISDFGYNTETSEITLTADKDAVVSASYEYGWELSDWLKMEQGISQINDSGNYTTEYTYTIPSHDGVYTVTAVKFELARPEGHVTDETIGTGTGRRQMIRLPHIARKETIVCNGKWSYDYDNQRLTIIAPENEPIVISYDWIAESPKVYSIAAGWAD